MRLVVALALGFSTAGACSKAPEATKAPSADVWAVVDGREIKKDDVEKAFKSALDPSQPQPSADEALTAKLNVVDDLVTQDILLARAKAAGLVVADTEVDTTVTERKGGATDDVFRTQLTAHGLTLDDLKTGVRKEMLVQKLLERDVNSKVNVTDRDVSDYYNANRAQFNLAEPQYRLAQIVVTSDKNPQLRNAMNDDAGTPADATKKVAMLVERLKGGGDFGALARDFSEDPQSAGRGGDMGFVPASALNRVTPQLRDAVLKMKPGAISTVSVGGNYTIIALVAHEPAGQRDLDTPSVKDGIRDMLKGRKVELLRTAYLSSARSDAKVVNYLAKQVVESQSKAPATLNPPAPGK